MSKHIILDSTPLGLLTTPTTNTEVLAITEWTKACLNAGHRIYIPEIIDYELRRELIRAGKQNSRTLLDVAKASFWYIAITTDAMLYAADLWAHSRNSGQPTGSPLKLDIDVILAAQALTVQIPAGDDIVVATDNVGHLSRFVHADLWSNIAP